VRLLQWRAKWCRGVSTTVLVASLGVALKSQSPPPDRADAWIVADNATIKRVLAERIGPNGVGAVVGVLEPAGTRIVTHGRSGAANGRPLDGDTVFQIGSVTKVFTGLLLADMVVRGQVELEDLVARYLPSGVRMPQRGRPITLLDLSKHWSGLPSMPTNFALDGQPEPYAAYTDAQLYEFLSTYELPREPGTQSYSNLGVALLGRLLARHAGAEYEPFLKARVLEPLALRDTSVTLTADQRARLAPGHDRYREPVDTWELLAMPASGSLRSTVNDLLHFLAENVDGNSPFAEAMELMRTPGRSLGWGRSTLGGEGVYGHEGGKEGYRSAVVFNPRTRTGVVVLTNARSDDSPMAIARHILYRAAPLPAPARRPVRPRTIALADTALDAFAGRYRLGDGTALRVSRRGKHLLVDVLGEGISTFFPFAPDRFFDNTTDAEISFVRAAGRRVSGLTFRSGETTRTGSRDVER
jgi:CubicO group peptidase (beta-lactamase class C family)